MKRSILGFPAAAFSTLSKIRVTMEVCKVFSARMISCPEVFTQPEVTQSPGLTDAGTGSPVIYSTADITAKNTKLTSTASEGVVIEGKNSVTLDNVELTADNNKLNGQSETYKTIFS